MKRTAMMVMRVRVLFVLLFLTVSQNLFGESGKGGAATAGSAKIQIVVIPEKLVLGDASKARLTASVRSPDGAPVACEDIRIHASQGSISSIAQTGVGEYTAEYLLPEDFFPRFSIIAASALCSSHTVAGSLVVKLFGSGTVDLRFEPNSDVVLQIAGERFGPHRTDEEGSVRIPIVIPPGVQTGRVGAETIDLNLPSVNRIVAIPEKQGISETSAKDLGILVFAIDDTTGEPLEDAKLKIKPKRGRIGKLVTLAPGVYRAHYKPPSDLGYGQDRVVVFLQGDRASETEVTMQLLSGIPAEIDVAVSPKEVPAGENRSVSVAIRVNDGKGNRTSAEIEARPDLGHLENLRSFAPGEYRATWILPGRLGVGGEARITAHLLKNREIRDEETIRFIAAASGPVAAGKGTAPAPEEEGADTEPEEGDQKEIAGDFPTYFMGITPGAGFLTNLKNVHTPLFSVPVDWHLRFLPGLHLGVDLGYFFYVGTYDPEDYRTTLHGFLFGAFLGYRIRAARWLFITPLAEGGGLLLGNRISLGGAETMGEAAPQAYGRFGVETGFRVGRGHLALRIDYMLAKADNLELFSGRIGGLNFDIGYRIELPRR